VIRAIDLTRPLSSHSLSYPGDRPGLCISRVDIGDPDCLVSELTRLDLHLGTHIDAPLHFIPRGVSIADLGTPLFPAVLIETPEDTIGPESIPDDVNGCAVLFDTGWTKSPDEPGYFEGYSTLTQEAANLLVERGAALVGFDTPSADTVSMELGFPIHRTFLAASIPIVEGLAGFDRLREVNCDHIWFGAFPLPLAGVEGSPIRAVAFVVEGQKIRET